MKHIDLSKNFRFSGIEGSKNILKKWMIQLGVYIVLIGISFVFIYPLIYIILRSFFTMDDILNPTINWIPNEITFDNYILTAKYMQIFKTTTITILYAGSSAFLQTLCCAVTGYGLGRFRFPLKKMWIALITMTFLIPVQVMTIPKYLLYQRLQMLGSPALYLLPAMLGQGIKSALFILIFYNFFRTYPKSIDEAAEIDGASKLKVFTSVALPMASTTLSVTFLFSFVWYWNETASLGLYMEGELLTVPLMLNQFVQEWQHLYEGTDMQNMAYQNNLQMAVTVIAILPLMIFYIFVQKRFTTSIENTGITGE